MWIAGGRPNIPPSAMVLFLWELVSRGIDEAKWTLSVLAQAGRLKNLDSLPHSPFEFGDLMQRTVDQTHPLLHTWRSVFAAKDLERDDLKLGVVVDLPRDFQGIGLFHLFNDYLIERHRRHLDEVSEEGAETFAQVFNLTRKLAEENDPWAIRELMHHAQHRPRGGNDNDDDGGDDDADIGDRDDAHGGFYSRSEVSELSWKGSLVGEPDCMYSALGDSLDLDNNHTSAMLFGRLIWLDWDCERLAGESGWIEDIVSDYVEGKPTEEGIEAMYVLGRELDGLDATVGFTESWFLSGFREECVEIYLNVMSKARRAALQTMTVMRLRGLPKDLARMISKRVYNSRGETSIWHPLTKSKSSRKKAKTVTSKVVTTRSKSGAAATKAKTSSTKTAATTAPKKKKATTATSKAKKKSNKAETNKKAKR